MFLVLPHPLKCSAGSLEPFSELFIFGLQLRQVFAARALISRNSARIMDRM